jgi:hypothetical protein
MSIFGMGLTMSAGMGLPTSEGIGVTGWAFNAGMSSPHAMATHEMRDFFKNRSVVMVKVLIEWQQWMVVGSL